LNDVDVVFLGIGSEFKDVLQKKEVKYDDNHTECSKNLFKVVKFDKGLCECLEAFPAVLCEL
jgi:hypothetical protein